MPVAARWRRWLEDALTLVPACAHRDIVARLRARDTAHRSAVWELACTKVLTGLGYSLEWHPSAPTGACPDWKVTGPHGEFFFEARVLEAPAEVERDRILDALNTLPDFGYYLTVRVPGVGQESPRTAVLLREVRAHLGAYSGRTWARIPAGLGQRLRGTWAA
ncbi:MAG: hypothetical protein ACRBN8_47060, partial [Nannocystales bacterium]